MNIGIYIYDDAEVLDFSGAFEVFSTAKRLSDNDWDVFLISENRQLVKARGGFLVQANYSFSDHPQIDVLVVVGGVHTAEMEKSQVTEWIKKISPGASLVASVCTGAFLLAQAGVIHDHSVTTHWQDIEDLKTLFPLLDVKSHSRWVKQNNIVTSAGISAGIDMSLFIVSQLDSLSLADKTAKQMDYDWQKIS